MAVLTFGHFELDLSHRRLTESGSLLQLGSRAFDILAVLASAAGEIVSKETLIEKVWPDTTVAEGALRVHLVTLRKLLGDRRTGRYIENVPGRGYVFVMPVEVKGEAVRPKEAPRPRRSNRGLPRLTERLIGRDATVGEIASLLKQNRVVTIAGAGGVGKTSVALAVGELVSAERDVLFLDLAALSDPREIIPTFATLLGFAALLEDTREAVLDALSERDCLIVMDNCEHLVAPVASLVEELVSYTVGTTILATSREPLRVAGEKIRQLPSLSVPPPETPVAEIRAYPAVELFIDRVLLSSEREDFASDDTIRAAADVVRRLDGIPLAIELAASGAANLGLHHLLGSLENPLSALRRGRRTAPPRQQTLRATLDWSYGNLTKKEQLLFHSVSMFAGAFSTEDAATVSAAALTSDDFYEAFDGLFLKSLLSVGSGDGKYRLLQTTRSYALEKVEQGGRSDALHLAHAMYCEAAMAKAAGDWTSLPTDEWLKHYGDLIHDLRSAINWALDSESAIQVGIDLASRSNIFWIQLGLMNEQIHVIERALNKIAGTALEGTEMELDLRMSRASAIYHTNGMVSDHEGFAEFRRAIEIAERVGNVPKLIAAESGIAGLFTSHGKYREAIELAQALRSRFPGLPRQTFSRLLEHNYFFHGDLKAARLELEGSLSDAANKVRRTDNHGMGYDQRLIAHAVLVFVDFLEGKVGSALDSVAAYVAEAKTLNYSIASCLLLLLSAVPLSLLAGRRDDAVAYMETAEAIAREHRLIRWQQWIRLYRLVFQDEELDHTLVRDLAEAKGLRHEYYVVLAGGRAPLGEIDRALAGDAGWCRAELLRLKSLALVDTEPREARAILHEAIELAQSGGALLWELRCRLTAHAFGIDDPDSMRALAAVVEKFERGSTMDDLTAARAMLVTVAS